MSYAHGASATPLMYSTLGGILRARASTHSDKELYVFPQDNVRKTVGQFMQDVSHVGLPTHTHVIVIGGRATC